MGQQEGQQQRQQDVRMCRERIILQQVRLNEVGLRSTQMSYLVRPCTAAAILTDDRAVHARAMVCVY